MSHAANGRSMLMIKGKCPECGEKTTNPYRCDSCKTKHNDKEFRRRHKNGMRKRVNARRLIEGNQDWMALSD